MNILSISYTIFDDIMYLGKVVADRERLPACL